MSDSSVVNIELDSFELQFKNKGSSNVTQKTTRSVNLVLPNKNGRVTSAYLYFSASSVEGPTLSSATVKTEGQGGGSWLLRDGNAYEFKNVLNADEDPTKRTYHIEFEFSATGRKIITYTIPNQGRVTSGIDFSILVTQVRLEIVYDSDGGAAIIDDISVDKPQQVEAPANSITLCDNVTKGVIAVLHPLKCTVTEQAGGEYELEMTYPVNDRIWQYIVTDRLIEAPVPPNHIDGAEVLNPKIWTVTGQTTLWARAPYSYTKQNTTITQSPSATIPTYSSAVCYSNGAKVNYGGKYYKCTQTQTTPSPPPGFPWQELDVTSGQSTTVYTISTGTVTVDVPGVEIMKLTSGTRLVKLADAPNHYMRVQTVDGVVGLVTTASCAETQEGASGKYYLISPRDIRRQYFRIYKTEVSSYDYTVTVYARHISYDLDNMTLGICAPVKASPAAALVLMQAQYISNTYSDLGVVVDERVIATDITSGEITQTWSYSSPVNAILDPESGMVSVLKARLYRDNDDYLIMDNGSREAKASIKYGVNLIGVSISTDASNIITRIIPIAKAENGTALYLPERYIDSDFIERYAIVHHEVLEVDARVGDSYTPVGESTAINLTPEDVCNMMREEVWKRYRNDACDQPQVEIQVEFLMLGDTEEYKQYKDLQYLNIYDVVRIVHPDLNIDTNVQVIGYEWDAILRRYNSITLGNPFEYESRSTTVPGYQIGTRAVSDRALTPRLKKIIEEARQRVSS